MAKGSNSKRTESKGGEVERRWIGFDLDGTLATFECGWSEDFRAIGEPIGPMVQLAREFILKGEYDVKIFTARMDRFWPGRKSKLPVKWVKKPIEQWCLANIGTVLPITNKKDYLCEAMYDDRAFRVEKDTGRII